mgnify:CR=1 FL=1
MDYMIKKEKNELELAYIILVEKDYYQPTAFKCLQRMEQDFNKFFDREKIINAKYLSLNREFEGAFERIYVR